MVTESSQRVVLRDLRTSSEGGPENRREGFGRSDIRCDGGLTFTIKRTKREFLGHYQVVIDVPFQT